MDLARGRERETVDHHGMDGALVQQVEQCGHIGFEILRVRRPACGDGIKHGVTAAKKTAQHVPQLEPRQPSAADAKPAPPRAIVCAP